VVGAVFPPQRDIAWLRIHLEDETDRVWRCIWRSWFRDHGQCNWASLKIQLQAVIEWVRRCAWMAWSSKIGRELSGAWAGGGCLGWSRHWSWYSVQWFWCHSVNVDNWVQHHLPRDEKTGWEQEDSPSWDDAVWSGCDTQCMMYSMDAVVGLCCAWSMLYWVLPLDYGMEKYRVITELCVLRWL